jgi:pimeloyl-ACP methyl ester carboxylesterase
VAASKWFTPAFFRGGDLRVADVLCSVASTWGWEVSDDGFGPLAGELRRGRADAPPTPPIVLLHGLTFDRSTWGPTIEPLRSLLPGSDVLSLDLPGHGASAPAPQYASEDVVEVVHAAVVAAGVEAPVVVGHSLGAVLSTIYGARHDTRAIVNVDQSLQVGPFVQLVKALRDQLQGPAFPAVWEQFSSSMGIDVLPPEARALVSAAANPDRDLVVGYWQEIIDRPAEGTLAFMEETLAGIREKDLPYHYLAGGDVTQEDTDWLLARVPRARISTVAGGGHFPHLADPEAFAGVVEAAAGA